jgi:1-aminocyclopropane-1-carboxylate deaminase
LISWASGNKYFKLKYPVQQALAAGKKIIVSKGGMFSNHLAALAEACWTFNIQLIAVIRSHQPDEDNPSIRYLRTKGAEIVYVDPKDYQDFTGTTAAEKYPGALFIPEGGLSQNGIKGTGEITSLITQKKPTHVIVSGGTMGTASGILSTAPSSMNVIIVPAWKGCTPEYVENILDQFSINPKCAWRIWPDYHFGGFGRFQEELIDFMSTFTRKYNIPLDPVYTGKMMYAIADQIKAGYFNEDDSMLSIHTGGLQGLKGYAYRFPDRWEDYAQQVFSAQ